MTVWVFGDSFAYLHLDADTWPRQVARKLNQELKCYGEGGTGLAYTYEKFNDVRNQIEDNDTVILAVTELNRRWFIRDRASENIWKIMSRREDPKLSNAVEYYLRYLDNEPVYESYLQNFLYNIQFLTNKKNLNTILLPCFNTSAVYLSKQNLNLTVASGELIKVSVAEFDPRFDHSPYTTISDIRPNHLTRSNHTILANKIIHSIQTKAPIDLNEGFVQHNVNDHNMLDEAFRSNELFQGS